MWPMMVAGALLALPASLRAQDPEYEKYLADEARKYDEYLSEEDRKFVAFLKVRWEPVQLTKAADRFRAPVPTATPVFTPPPAPRAPTVTSAPDAVRVGPVLPPPPRVQVSRSGGATASRDVPRLASADPAALPDVEAAPGAPLPGVTAARQATVGPARVAAPGAGPAAALSGAESMAGALDARFFGNVVPVRPGRFTVPEIAAPFSAQKIAGVFEALAKSDYEPLLLQADGYRRELKLGDWGYAQLLGTMGGRLFGTDSTRIRLFTWFMLLKSGYATRVGYDDARVYVLFSSAVPLYSVPRFTMGDTTRPFFAIPLDGRGDPGFDRLFTYKTDYPGASRKLEFRMPEVPDFTSGDTARVLQFRWKDTTHRVAVRVNRNWLHFLRWYPRQEMDGYFVTPFSPEAKATLHAGLRPLLAKRTVREQVELLLRFTQTAFAYQTNEQQFGRDKPFFPDETLYYPASDCKGRSVFFAALVRDLLGLEVVGLDYPDHIATAVRLPAAERGDAVTWRGARYVVADPTYINASVGMTMPKYVNVPPQVIAIP